MRAQEGDQASPTSQLAGAWPRRAQGSHQKLCASRSTVLGKALQGSLSLGSRPTPRPQRTRPSEKRFLRIKRWLFDGSRGPWAQGRPVPAAVVYAGHECARQVAFLLGTRTGRPGGRSRDTVQMRWPPEHCEEHLTAQGPMPLKGARGTPARGAWLVTRDVLQTLEQETAASQGPPRAPPPLLRGRSQAH